jgi:hypothetical protein
METVLPLFTIVSNLERSSTSNGTILTSSLRFKQCEFPNNPYYILFASIVSFYLPLIVMIYVYIQVYVAAKKQALALRSGYKNHYRIKSAKIFSPKFRLRKIVTRKRPRIEAEEEIDESSLPPNAAMLLANRRPSPELITLRIHHGSYQNPTIKVANRSNGNANTSGNAIGSNRGQPRSFWQKLAKDQKAAKFVGIIMGVFVVCWLPYFVYLVLSGVFIVRLKDDQYHELLFKIFSWLGYTNSALDVLLCFHFQRIKSYIF